MNTDGHDRRDTPLVIAGPGGDYDRTYRPDDLRGEPMPLRLRLILLAVAAADIALIVLAISHGS